MAQVPESAGHKSFSKRVWGEAKGTLGSPGSSLVLPNALPHTQLNWTPEPPPLPSSHFFPEPLALALVLQSKARASQLASASFLSLSAHGCHLPQTESPQWEPQTLQQDRMALPQDLCLDCPSPAATLVHSSIPVLCPAASLCPRGSYAREPQISITHCSSLPPDTALQGCV